VKQTPDHSASSLIHYTELHETSDSETPRGLRSETQNHVTPNFSKICSVVLGSKQKNTDSNYILNMHHFIHYLWTIHRWLRLLVTSLWLHRSMINPRPDHVRHAVDKVALGQTYLSVFSFPLLISFHQCSIPSHPSLTLTLRLPNLFLNFSTLCM
jgi:hypothetical protein